MSDDYSIAEVKDLSTLIADKLMELIHDGVLRPGERLIQTELAERFGVSRVAIRDALMKLRQRGLSVNHSKTGEIVRPVTWKSVQDVFAVRRLLETDAVREAVPQMTDAAILAATRRVSLQRTALEAGDIKTAIQEDWAFHFSIYEHCDNPLLLQMIEQLWLLIRQARGVGTTEAAWGNEWSRRSVGRHEKLLGAIIERDAETAASIMEAIIDESAEELVAKLKELGWGLRQHPAVDFAVCAHRTSTGDHVGDFFFGGMRMGRAHRLSGRDLDYIRRTEIR